MSNVPLPEPAFSLRWERGEHKVSPPMDDCDCYTADQMHAYAASVSAAKDAEIAALRAENDKLREALAQKVVSQTMLTGLTVQDGGLTMGLQGGAAGLLAEMLTQQFKDGGGINYLQLSFTSSVALPGEAFIVTVQKCSGKTPHQLRMEAEAEAAGLREDAGRYRWLRDKQAYIGIHPHYKDLPIEQRSGWTIRLVPDVKNSFDAAIDAALAARKGEA